MNNDSNARSAWWLCTSTYAFGFVVMHLGRELTLACKTKNFPSFISLSGEGSGESRQKDERKFLFCFATCPPKSFVSSPIQIEGFPLHFSPYQYRPRRYAHTECVVTPTRVLHTTTPRTGRSHLFTLPARCDDVRSMTSLKVYICS